MVKKIIHFFKQNWLLDVKITLATLCTIFRMVLTPFIGMEIVNKNWYIASILFIFASISDFLDGFLARVRNEQTILGACLDPIADKFLLIVVIFAFSITPLPFFEIPRWFVAFVCVRELLMIVAGFFIWLLKGPMQLKPTIWGKLTTTLYLFFILFLFISYFYEINLNKFFIILLGSLVVCSIGTFVHYINIVSNLLKVHI